MSTQLLHLKQSLRYLLGHALGDTATVNGTLNKCCGDVLRAAAEVIQHGQCCLLGCRRAIDHKARDLMHSACIKIILTCGRIRLLPLGGWLLGQLAVIVLVLLLAVILPRHVNDALNVIILVSNVIVRQKNDKTHSPESVLIMPLPLLPWICICNIPNIHPRSLKLRGERNMLLKGVQLFLAW